MKRKIGILLLLSVSWFLIHETIIVIDGLTDNASKSDYIVILGNTVNRDGTLSERLQARMDTGLKLYRNGIAPKLFVSGGLGKEGFCEGTQMAEYLIEHGVPITDIVVDNTGNTTALTALNFAKTIKNSQGKSVIIVSQFYHISRCKLAFQKQGFKKVTAAHAPYFELRDTYSLFREFFGYYTYLITL